MSEHLGDLSAALVDDALSHDARDKALAHLMHCPQCRAEVDSQRRLRALLANQPDPAPSAELNERLRAIAHSEPLDSTPVQSTQRRWPLFAAAAFAPAQSRPTGVRRPRDTGPAGRPAEVRRRQRVVRRTLAGSVAALAITAGLATIGGTSSSSGPATTPPVDRFVQEHAMMTARLPFGDAGAGAVEFVVLGR